MCWPKCFLPSVVEKTFLGTSAKQLSIKEIPDFDIQLKLQIIAYAKTEDEFQKIVDTFPEIFRFGVTKFIKECIYTANYSAYLLFNVLRKNPQDFKSGLEQYGLYSVLSEHFAHPSKEFSLSQGITFTEIIKIFQTVLYRDASTDVT